MMRHTLKLSRKAFIRIATDLEVRPEHVGVYRVGRSEWPDSVEWLLNDTVFPSSSDGLQAGCAVATGVTRSSEIGAALKRATEGYTSNGPATFVVLGTRGAAGRIAGVHRNANGTVEPLDAVRVVGPGLPAISLQTASLSPARRDAKSLHANLASKRNAVSRQLWSRSRAALDEGVWDRLAALHVGIVGGGRIGSMVATSAKRNGTGRVTLVDPDRLEMGNLGEMDSVTVQDVGSAKVEAIVDFFNSHNTFGRQNIAGVTETVLSLSAWVALKPADVLFSCVDNAKGRLAAAWIASLLLKPIVDLGTGIFRREQILGRASREVPKARADTVRQMGADIRLILPGRCLLCYGGIAGLVEAREELGTHASGIPVERAGQEQWKSQRAGSLRSLNGVAVNLGFRLLEDLMDSRIRGNVWLHLDFDETGIPTLERRTPPLTRVCPLCALAGRGDEGLRDLPNLLQTMGLNHDPR